ncbi:META domain-containing protein [Rubrivirga sp. IMCC45206]|uniref:META domain-containing protein n=1 Tax=Rubrivirga sp. IMCC45206 TaxID=3391614 RepID=UPI00398FDFFB
MRPLVLALALSACAPDAPPPDAASSDRLSPAPVVLSGTWRLAALDGAPLPDGTGATATFSGGRLSGVGGCNEYWTGYALDGDRFRLADDVVWHLQACGGAADSLEAAFSVRLGLARRVRLDERLVLLDSLGAERLAFGR